jgi:hypothetical protein
MDTLMHAVHGGLMMAAISDNPWYIFLSAIIGALPDLIGEAERIYKKDNSLWNWYNIAHAQPGYYGVLSYLKFTPPYMLHIWLDSFTHTEGKNRWWVKNEGLSYEISAWLFTILLLFILLIFKYNII